MNSSSLGPFPGLPGLHQSKLKKCCPALLLPSRPIVLRRINDKLLRENIAQLIFQAALLL
jgi:hypothetical protein